MSSPHLSSTVPSSEPSPAQPSPDEPVAAAEVDEGSATPEAPEPTPNDRLATIEAAVVELGQRIAADSERAVARERVIDRQHEEVERLRSERRASPLRPTIVDLARLRNDLLRQAATVPDEMTGADVAKLLHSYADVVEDTLERCGVAVLARETGGAFTPGRQQAAGFVETDDPTRDSTVVEVVKDGYAEHDGKVVVPARVTIHRYTISADDSGIDSTEGTDD